MPAAQSKFAVLLNEDARRQFAARDNSVRERIRKRLELLRALQGARTLKGHSDIWVLEIGNWRALYLADNAARIKTVFFIGDHKEYGRRYWQMFGKRRV